MRKHKALLSLLLFCFAGWAAYSQSPSWKVEIRLAQTAVKNKQDFSVATAVRNISEEEQTLDVLNCPYANWRADNPAVHLNEVNCAQDSLVKFRLKPGETHEMPVSVHIELAANSAGRKSITFRLRFFLANSLRASGSRIVAAPVWSNPVTIVVTR